MISTSDQLQSPSWQPDLKKVEQHFWFDVKCKTFAVPLMYENSYWCLPAASITEGFVAFVQLVMAARMTSPLVSEHSVSENMNFCGTRLVRGSIPKP